jgi:hypothetical protein
MSKIIISNFRYHSRQLLRMLIYMTSNMTFSSSPSINFWSTMAAARLCHLDMKKAPTLDSGEGAHHCHCFREMIQCALLTDLMKNKHS